MTMRLLVGYADPNAMLTSLEADLSDVAVRHFGEIKGPIRPRSDDDEEEDS